MKKKIYGLPSSLRTVTKLKPAIKWLIIEIK